MIISAVIKETQQVGRGQENTPPPFSLCYGLETIHSTDSRDYAVAILICSESRQAGHSDRRHIQHWVGRRLFGGKIESLETLCGRYVSLPVCNCSEKVAISNFSSISNQKKH